MEIMTTLPGVEPHAEAGGAFVSALALVVPVLMSMGRHDLADAYIKRMEQVGGPLADRDPAIRGWLSYARGDRSLHQGEPWSVVELCQRAAASFEEAGERQYLIVMAHSYVGVGYAHLGAYAACREIGEAMLAQSEPDTMASGAGKWLLAMALIGVGELDAARGGLMAEVEAMAARGAQLSVGPMRYLLAQVELRRGDLEAAERAAREAIELVASSPRLLIMVLAMLAEVLVRQGRAVEALAVIERGFSVQRSLPPAYAAVGHLSLVHAEALAETGEHARAREALAEGRAALLAQAERIGDPALRRSFLEAVPEHARLMALSVSFRST